MLLSMKDEAEINLNAKKNDFMLDNSFRDETLEELTAAVIMMDQIQPAGDNAVTEPTYDANAVSEDDVSVIPDPVLVDEDEDPEEDEFEEEEDPQEEEYEVDIEEDENEPELTYPYEVVDPLNHLPPASESRKKTPLGIRSSVEGTRFEHRQLCGRKTAHELVKKKGKAKDEYIAAIRRMIKENVDVAIAAERARHANIGNDARGSRLARSQDVAPAVRECTFAGFIKCNYTAFHGNEGAVELLRWFEKTESVFGISECAEGTKRLSLLLQHCKENGVNILKSIDEGPFQMGIFRETLAEGALGPERPRVYSDLSPEDKDRYNADIRATNILLQGLPKDIYSLINHYTDAKDIWDNVKMLMEGSELTKEDRESQLYDDFEHFRQNKGKTIHDYYARFAKFINDMRNIKMTMSRMQLNSKFVNNMLPEWGRFVTVVKLNRGLRDSNYDQLYAYLKADKREAQPKRTNQYNSQSSTNPSSTYVPPHFADNSQLNLGLSPTDNLIENLTNTLALLTQSYKTYLPQTNNQLKTSSNPRNQATVQDGKVVVQNVQGGHDNAVDEDVDEQPVKDLALNVDNVFNKSDDYLIKMKAEALKMQATASRPTNVDGVPPNTPGNACPRVASEQRVNKNYNFALIQLFFRTLKKLVTERNHTTGLTEVEGFEHETMPVSHRDRKHDEIEQKNFLIANDNLIIDCLSKEVFYVATNSELNLKYQNLKESFGNNTSPPTRDVPDFDSVFVIEKMKASIQGKDNAIKKLRMQISQLNETRSEADRTLDFRTLDFQITQLTEKINVLQEQNELFRAENGKIKQHYKELYDSIKITRAKHLEQTTALLTKNESLKVQIQNKLSCVNKDHVKPKVLAPGKYAIDVEPIPPRNRNNREVHLDYLKHLKESVETLHEIVKEAKVVRPLDSSLSSACRSPNTLRTC
ncbi:hypothetical protein Tco_1183143 [Tanacetum coccineum]